MFSWPRVNNDFSNPWPRLRHSSSSSSYVPAHRLVPGIESGGHGSASAPPVLNLIPQILSALPPSGAPPVLAAGGLSSGAHLAAFLTLGAAGAVVGTRFLVAEESQYSDAQKRAIIAAKSGSAVRSYVFDQLRDTTGWPAGVDGRGLAIPAVAAVEGGGDVTQIKEEVAEGTKRGDPRSVIAWAGTGVGPLTRLQPAKVMGHLRSLCVSEFTARHNRISCGSYMKSLWHA
jgi:nitronate monooxygenase